MNIECYKCQEKINLLIEEKIEEKTNKILEKKFICFACAKEIFIFRSPIL